MLLKRLEGVRRGGGTHDGLERYKKRLVLSCYRFRPSVNCSGWHDVCMPDGQAAELELRRGRLHRLVVDKSGC